MIYDHRLAREVGEDMGPMTYEHNVVPFKKPDRANAAYSAQLLEESRIELEVSPNRREERRLFNAYMAAIREQVSAADRVNEAHNAWMKAAEKVGA